MSYIDNNNIHGSEEKAIRTKALRLRLAKTVIKKEFNDSTHQLSAIPAKRKNRYQNNNAGIHNGDGLPQEQLINKPPLSYQSKKLEDDNVRFLALNERRRPYNPATDRRYQKFQTATQRVANLNVFPDGTHREEGIRVAALDAAMKNQAIIDELKNLPASIASMMPAPAAPVVAAPAAPVVAAPVAPVAAPVVSAPVAALTPLSAAIEKKLDEILLMKRSDVVDEINRAKAATQVIVEEDAKNGVASDPILLTIKEKIERFNESKFVKSGSSSPVSARKLSEKNKEALEALAVFLAKAAPTATPSSSGKSTPITVISPTSPAALTSPVAFSEEDYKNLDKDIDAINAKTMNKTIQHIHKAMGENISIDAIGKLLETPDGIKLLKEELYNLSQGIKLDVAKIDAFDKGSTIKTTSSLQALMDFYGTTPDKLTDPSSNEFKAEAKKTFDLVAETINNTNQDQANEAFGLITKKFEMPSSLKTDASKELLKAQILLKARYETSDPIRERYILELDNAAADVLKQMEKKPNVGLKYLGTKGATETYEYLVRNGTISDY